MSVAPRPRSAPAEEDLQNLYNQVWASYSDPPPAPAALTTSAERDLEAFYNAYVEPGDDASGRLGPNGTANGGAGARLSGLPTSPRDHRMTSSSISQSISPVSPNGGRSPRPLPRPPGGAPSPNSPHGMPEPRPYSPGPSRPTPPSADYSTIKSGHSANYRPTNGTRPGSSSSSSTSPVSLAPSASSMAYSMPIPDIKTSDPDLSFSGAWNATPVNGTSLNGAAHAYRASDGDARLHSPAGSMSSVMGGLPPRSASRTGMDPHARMQSLDLGTNGSYQDPNVNRTSSITSSISSYQSSGLLRNSSVASSSLYSPASTVMLGPTSPASGPGASLDRGNSFHSYASKQSGEYPTLQHRPSFAISDSMIAPPAPGAGGGGYLAQTQSQMQSSSQGQTPIAGPSTFLPDTYDPDAIASLKGRLGLHEDAEYDDYFDLEEDEEDDRFVNFALLSHLAVRLRDNVPRGTHVKGSIPYPRAFTGKDIVSTIQSQIQRELLINHGISTNDRRAALQVARSLQSQLFFYEVEWGGRVLQDGVEDVYMFLDDQEGGAESQRLEREELPTGVITMLTKCYSPSCTEEDPCYAFACPRKKETHLFIPPPSSAEAPEAKGSKDWSQAVGPEILTSLPTSEVNRQTIIHKIISKEEQYVHDLDLVDSLFIRALRKASPPIIRPDLLEPFIEDVFHNILDLRECNRRLLEHLYVRQREQGPVIQRIGDVFLGAATEFRLAYPEYVGHLPLAEKRMKEEIESNLDFRMFLEQCLRNPDSRRLDLKHFLSRPSEHLQKYPVLLEAILQETMEGNSDADFLREAINAIKGLQTGAQLLTFQSAMGKGASGKLEWHDLVSPDVRAGIEKHEAKRQSVMFELISGEGKYVRDLENLEVMYIQPLRAADPPIIPPQRLDAFIQDVFHNFAQLAFHHRRLLAQLHLIQQEEHPVIHSITAALLDAFLNFRDAYLDYIPNYPIAAYRIEDEKANNPRFKEFHDQAVRHSEADRQDMKTFVNRPIPRLLRYQLLMETVLKETPDDHEDKSAIPQLLEVIKSLGKETEPGVASAEQKVELWRYNSNLVFKPGEYVDMDLLDENRSLIHAGKLLRQPETGFEWSGWSELFVLLFDNYLVMTKPKEKDGVTKYHVNRRPIPLDLLTLATFSDAPTQRSTGILRGLRGGDRGNADPGAAYTAQATPESATDSRSVFPCTIHHNGRMGGLYTLYAESSTIRIEWKKKLEEAIGLRKVVQESNKVFEIETLSADTFLVPSMLGPASPSWNNETVMTGKVTCSIPFNTADGRALMAIGCAEGVWIGFRHDSRSLRRVLHLKMVTQCAMLEDFGIFLVLADKSLFAYHIEALVPSSMQSAHMSQTPQKLSGTKDVHFFTVGNLNGRTLVIYMKKKGLDSVFRVLEPVVSHIQERARAPTTLGSRLGLRSQRSDWFRTYREFFLPSEAFDLIFLKAKIAVLCTKGFEIMDLTDFKSVTIPQRDDPRLEKLAKRCESCRPMGMFRSNADEFLLCYDEFGLYVDRHGDPSRSMSTIEWEGTAERVAWHQPYVLLFDTRFIEVRHVETGRLVQIIPGHDVRCIWDGRGAKTAAGANSAAAAATPGPEGWGKDGHFDQEARVHAVMNAPDPVVQQPGPGGRSARAVATAQHVFELIPTIPLYLPGALSSPSASTYFPQGSPPLSPRASLNTTNTASWR